MCKTNVIWSFYTHFTHKIVTKLTYLAINNTRDVSQNDDTQLEHLWLCLFLLSATFKNHFIFHWLCNFKCQFYLFYREFSLPICNCVDDTKCKGFIIQNCAFWIWSLFPPITLIFVFCHSWRDTTWDKKNWFFFK